MKYCACAQSEVKCATHARRHITAQQLHHQTHEIKIRLSQTELDFLNAQVAKTRLSREQFCRNAIRGVTIRENPPADLHKLIWEIRRVGNNIDQIPTIANAKGLLDVPCQCKTIADLREAEKLIAAAYEQPR